MEQEMQRRTQLLLGKIISKNFSLHEYSSLE